MLKCTETRAGRLNARVVIGHGLEELRNEVLHACLVSSSLEELSTNLDMLPSKVRVATGKRISVDYLPSDLREESSLFILTELRNDTEPCLKSWQKEPEKTDTTLCVKALLELTRLNIHHTVTSSDMERVMVCLGTHRFTNTECSENCPLLERSNELYFTSWGTLCNLMKAKKQ